MFLKKLTKAAAVKRGKGKSKRKEQKARKKSISRRDRMTEGTPQLGMK